MNGGLEWQPAPTQGEANQNAEFLCLNPLCRCPVTVAHPVHGAPFDDLFRDALGPPRRATVVRIPGQFERFCGEQLPPNAGGRGHGSLARRW